MKDKDGNTLKAGDRVHFNCMGKLEDDGEVYMGDTQLWIRWDSFDCDTRLSDFNFFVIPENLALIAPIAPKEAEVTEEATPVAVKPEPTLHEAAPSLSIRQVNYFYTRFQL